MKTYEARFMRSDGSSYGIRCITSEDDGDAMAKAGRYATQWATLVHLYQVPAEGDRLESGAARFVAAVPRGTNPIAVRAARERQQRRDLKARAGEAVRQLPVRVDLLSLPHHRDAGVTDGASRKP